MSHEYDLLMHERNDMLNKAEARARDLFADLDRAVIENESLRRENTSLRNRVAEFAEKIDRLEHPDAGMFIAKDGYNDTTLWREDEGYEHVPTPLFRKYGNEVAWDLFVEGRFPVREDDT